MSQRNVFYYDGASNLICVRDPDLGLTYYQYDLLDRVISVKNPTAEVTYYDYNTGGQVKTRKLGNHALVYYTYDSARRVTRIQHRTSALAQIATLNYQYDHVGNPVSIIREDSSATYFSYDSIYQLTAETQLDSGGSPTYQAEYQYDGAHNRTVKVIAGAPAYYTYNEANQLETEKTAAGTVYYHYDGCGNTTAKQAAGGTTYLQYNTENLLTRIDFAAGGGHAYYTYDGDSKRVSQRTADGYTGFVYQGPDMLGLQLERNEAGTTQAHYTIGQGLESVRRSGVSHFYHYNHLGTTIALTASNQTVSDTYEHDAWGVLLSSTGSTVNPHTYVGRERYYRMANADLYHLGFRDYAQAIGRFMTVDPALVREGEHAARSAQVRGYAYAVDRPTVAVDPTGEIPLLPIVVGGIITIGVAAWVAHCALSVALPPADTIRATGRDKLAHCVFFCEFARCMLLIPRWALSAWLGGAVFEISEKVGRWGVYDLEDMHANWIGIVTAYHCWEDCEAGCIARLPSLGIG